MAQISNVDDLLDLVRAILSDINMGLLIYHAEDPGEASKLKLVYANEEASEYTETNLQQRVGKYILDAFPPLKETELPRTYLEVFTKKQARQIGVIDYADQTIREGAYSVKAFPLPANCVGVIFEDIEIRKQVDNLVIKQRDDLIAQTEALTKDLHEVLRKSQSLRKSIANDLSPEHRKTLDQIIEIAGKEMSS